MNVNSGTTKKSKVKKSKVEDDIVSRSDENGNLIIIRRNPKRVILSLKLVNEKKYRRVGEINKQQRVMTVRRTKKFHLLRAADSYGFNHQILKDAHTFDFVRILTDEAEYKIPRLTILDIGDFLWFKHQGFEKQIFLSREQLSHYKREVKF